MYVISKHEELIQYFNYCNCMDIKYM